MSDDQTVASETAAAARWTFEDGILTVAHRGATISLGRYATSDHAERAALKYFAKNDAADSAG